MAMDPWVLEHLHLLRETREGAEIESEKKMATRGKEEMDERDEFTDRSTLFDEQNSANPPSIGALSLPTTTWAIFGDFRCFILETPKLNP